MCAHISCVHRWLPNNYCTRYTFRERFFSLKISELDKACNISTLVYSFKLSIVEDRQTAMCAVNIFTSDGPGSQELKLQHWRVLVRKLPVAAPLPAAPNMRAAKRPRPNHPNLRLKLKAGVACGTIIHHVIMCPCEIIGHNPWFPSAIPLVAWNCLL